MKKNRIFVLLLVVMLGLVEVGCGQNYAGTYTGTATITYGQTVSTGTTGGTGLPTSTSATITIGSSNNNGLVSVSWQDTIESGSGQGTQGGGSITGITLSMTPSSSNGMYGSYGYGYGSAGMMPGVGMGAGYGTMPGYGYGGAGMMPGYGSVGMGTTSCTFTGSFTVNNNQITGTLTGSGTQAVGTMGALGGYSNMGGAYSSPICSGSRSVTANKTN